MRRALRALELVAIFAAVVGGMWLVSEHHRMLPIDSACSLIRDGESRTDCIGRSLVDDVRDDGVARVAARIADSDFNTSSDCHQSLHALGVLLADRTWFDPRDLRPTVTGLCTSGIIHGIETRWLAEGSRSVAEIVQVACEFPGAKVEEAASCYHGIGHGVELANHRTALKRCAGMTRSFGRAACENGAWMERSNANTPSEQVAMCDKAGSFRAVCLTYVPNAERAAGQDDTKRLLRSCMRFTSIERWSCIHGAATFMPDLSKVGSCNALPSPVDRTVCVETVFTSDLTTTSRRAFDLCHDNGATAVACASGAGRFIRAKSALDASPAELSRACGQLLGAGRSGDACRLTALSCVLPRSSAASPQCAALAASEAGIDAAGRLAPS